MVYSNDVFLRQVRCREISLFWCFGGTCCLCLQGEWMWWWYICLRQLGRHPVAVVP